MRSLSVAATGMLAQQLNVDVISNNIANLSTTGFKRRRAEFADLLYQNYRRVGSQSSDSGTIVPSGVQIGVGVKPTAVYRITEQGNMQVTDNPLDLAISGKGYFQVELPNGHPELATFPNEAGLEAIGDNLFLETQASGGPITATPGTEGFGTIQQGFLE